MKIVKSLKSALISPRTRSTRVVLVVVAAVAIAAVSLMGTAIAQAVTLATTHQPERFTELYFNDQQQLPRSVTPDHPASFSYHITNHEGATKTYRVRITQVTDGNLKVIAEPEFTLVDGQSINAKQVFQSVASHQNYELIVEIPASGTNIHFRSQS